MSPLRRLTPFLKSCRLQIAGAIVALVISAGTVLALGQGLRLLIDRGFATGHPEVMDRALMALLAAVCILALATYGRFFLVSRIGERVIADIRKALFSHIVRLSPAFFETHRTGDILSRLTVDTTVLQTVVGSSVSTALRNILLFSGGAGLLMVTSPRLTSLVFVMVPLVVAPILVLGRKVRRLSRSSQESVADVGARAEEVLSAIRTVQAFTREANEQERFAGTAEEAFDTAMHRVRLRAFLTALVILLAFGGVGLVLWVGGHDVLAGRMTSGQLSSFVFYAVVVAGSVGAISEVVGDLQRAAGAAGRIFGLMDAQSDI
nr:ABC transporter transmembrane domain-containing protein [Pseudomonadota bacterium]